MTNYIECVPAYGRDYESAKSVKEAYEQGKDFQDATSGQYLNKDSPFQGATVLNIRYNGMRSICVIKAKK